MTWGLVIGAGVSLYGAKKASSASSKANANADQANKASIEANQADQAFQQQVYDDWKAVFGDVQTNLASYYKNLNPTFATAQGLEAFETEKNRALTNIREGFEQRGIATSGLAYKAEADVSMLSAVERAKIRANAPRQVAEEKLGFLNAGLAASPVAGLLQSKSNAAANASKNSQISSANAGAAEESKWGAYGEATTAVINGIEGIGAKREPTDAI